MPGIAAYLLLSKSGVVSVPGATAAAAATSSGSTYSQAYYLASIYPAMKIQDPNILNPSYTLTAAEAQQYYNNYSDLQQWFKQMGSTHVPGCATGDLTCTMQYHWKLYGVPEQRTFLPLVPPDGISVYVPPPSNKSSSGGSSTISSIISVVGTVAALFGVDRLNDKDLEIIFTGSALAKQILPLYNNNFSTIIDNKINQVLNDYTT